MRKGFLLSLGVLLAGAALARAQAPLPTAGAPTAPALAPGVVLDQAPVLSSGDLPATGFAAENGGEPCFYATGEYLLWWVKDGPLPAPLVTTTTNLNGDIPGALGQPDTRTLFGGQGLDYGTFAGMRLTVGSFLNAKSPFGIEGGAFLLEGRTAGFGASSDNAGNPPLYYPFFRPDLGREGSFIISDPVSGLTGSTAITSQTRLWGAEVNAVGAALRHEKVAIDLLVGFRYMDLAENLNIKSTLVDPVNLVNDDANDHFGTRNQFYGVQLGARTEMKFGRASVGLLSKIALGSSHQVVDINGGITETGAGAFTPGTFPGGIYTQRTNISRRSHNRFAALPQAQVKVGYRVLSHLEAFVGYDLLYWGDVVRPGRQIDRNINPSQFLGQPLAGPAAPQAPFNLTNFWAQGVTFGLTFRY